MTHPPSIEEQVVEITRKLVTDLGHQRAIRLVSVDASLERDLGLGSLEKVELLLRLERALSIQVPDHVVAKADTLRELVQAVRRHEAIEPVRESVDQPVLEEASFHPTTAATLSEVLAQYAEKEADRPHIYLQNDDGSEQTISYGQLYEAVRATASGLWNRRLRPGETVAIMLPTGRDFFCAFLGIILAGGIPVPIYPPYRPDRLEEYAQRQATILRNAEARLLILFERVEGLAQLLRPFVPSLREVTTIERLATAATPPPNLILRSDDAAMIQYTSGSTSDPKGVLLSHANILANIRAVGAAAQIGPTDVGVSWLPLYHDMGLIGSWLCCLYYGIPITILTPFAFLNRPERWLWAIHYHRGTLSAAPNFAYELCIKKIENRAIEGLDLSSWRIAFNGAESVNPDTIERFTRRFAPYGFNPETLLPVYGLAESSVALTFPPLGHPPKIDRIRREIFQTEHRAEPASSADTSALRFVSCGTPLPGHQIQIVDEHGQAVGERTEGSLRFKGPSSMQGYFRSPEATKAVHCDGWWDSGDLAYQAEGEIYITGRRKDVIIKAGRNLYPHEVEDVVGEIEGVRKGCVVASGVYVPDSGTEDLLVVAETRETRPAQRDRIISAVIDKVVTTVGVPPDNVVLVPPGTVPKTSSGKLRRAACREAYLRGEFRRRRMPVWWQAARLFVTGVWPRTQQGMRSIPDNLYSLYAWLIVALTVPTVWLIVRMLPRGRMAAQVSRYWARTFLWLIRCPLSVDGQFYLEKTGPWIFVANHTSYLDAVIIMAALPPGYAFLAKKELAKAPIIRTFIHKVGHLTVDRMDFSQSVSDAKRIEEALRDGKSVVIFPEGTFTRAVGLRPFKLGAFKVAAESSTPVIPISLRGSRHILWPDTWRPRRGSVQVVIGAPITPKGTDWREMVRLRDRARTEIARHCGEEPLEEIAAGPQPATPQ